jgi:hypothetical protein
VGNHHVLLGIKAANGERFQVAIGATNFDGPDLKMSTAVMAATRWRDV